MPSNMFEFVKDIYDKLMKLEAEIGKQIFPLLPKNGEHHYEHILNIAMQGGMLP